MPKCAGGGNIENQFLECGLSFLPFLWLYCWRLRPLAKSTAIMEEAVGSAHSGISVGHAADGTVLMKYSSKSNITSFHAYDKRIIAAS